MPYKVLIVDDEKLMRDGLTNMVDWLSLGFEISAQLEDGQDTIEYLKNSSVDVILTDIKMTFISGLELAKFVFDSKLPTKVVLISGYQDFEFARKAVSYDVKHYLLKPISISDIKKVFIELKKELDLEKERRKQLQDKEILYNELLSLLHEQFFSDLVYGALRSRDEILRRLNMLKINLDIDKGRCCLFTVFIKDYKNFIKNTWDYNEDDLYSAISNFIFMEEGNILYSHVRKRDGKLQGLAISLKLMSEVNFEENVKTRLYYTLKDIRTVIGLNLTFEVNDLFVNIIELARNINPLRLLHDKANDENVRAISDEDMEKIRDQQKLFIAHITSGNSASVNSLFEKLIEELKPLGLKLVQIFVIDLFGTIIEKLRQAGIEYTNELTIILQYSKVYEFNSIKDIEVWGKEKFSYIIEETVRDRERSDNSIIHRVKKYIIENYSHDITLETIADQVYLSPVYISRLFKEQTKENYSDYLLRIRMEKAKELLCIPGKKVYEVSNMVGYSSIKHFYKLFKKYTGYTPKEYQISINR